MLLYPSDMIIHIKKKWDGKMRYMHRKKERASRKICLRGERTQTLTGKTATENSSSKTKKLKKALLVSRKKERIPN